MKLRRLSKLLGMGILSATLLASSAYAANTIPGGPSTNGNVSYESMLTYDEMIKKLEDIQKTSKVPLEVFTLADILEEGKSESGRDLYVAKMGEEGAGKKKIWVQAQIHGNEKLGTEAVFEVMKNLSTDKNNKQIQTILEHSVIYFIPMYNPDGAEANTRGTNILGTSSTNFDLNRDWALNGFKAKESRAFYTFWAQVKPDFMIDIHHQGLKTVPGTNESTSMSLGISLAPNGPTMTNPELVKGTFEEMSYRDATRAVQGYVYNSIIKYGYTHIDRYTTGNRGQNEIDIRGGVASAVMLGLNWNDLNPTNHSHPAIFFETKGNTNSNSIGQKANGHLTKQNTLGLQAALYGIASGDALKQEYVDVWENTIPIGKIEFYQTDYSGMVPVPKN